MISKSRRSPVTPVGGATLTVDQAHEKIGKANISRAALYLAITHNQIPSLRLGRRILIRRAAFEQWLQSGCFNQGGADRAYVEPASGPVFNQAIKTRNPTSRKELRKLFKKHHGSIKRVADRLGLSSESVSHWLKGHSNSQQIEVVVLEEAEMLLKIESNVNILHDNLTKSGELA